MEKVFDLKEYVDTLFEWLKLESGERIFSFENTDICELSREIISDWIPHMEQKHLDYFIEIPETEIKVMIDCNAYKRIINNILQNIFVHSNASKIEIGICVVNQMVEIKIMDRYVFRVF